jgi:hypothetical protein
LRGETEQSEGTEKTEAKRTKQRGEAFKKKREEQKETERRVKEQDRRGRRRATVAPLPAPPPFLPATTDRTATARD